jgi:perosamine synthetase
MIPTLHKSSTASELTTLTYYRGRVALASILRALGIGRNDEVAIQAFTCVAVPEAILAVGAVPTYIDIEKDGYTIDPSDLAAKITPTTKAVVVQHTFGIPADMDRIVAVAAAHGIPVIEDCCHTLTSAWNGRTVGTFGIASFYSFEWGKPLVAGLGGSALTRDEGLAARIEADYRERFLPPSMGRCLKIELQYHLHRLVYRPETYWAVRSAFHLLCRLGATEGNYNHLPGENGPAMDFTLRMAPSAVYRLQRKIAKIDREAEHSRSIACEYHRIFAYSATMLFSPHSAADVTYARFPLRVLDKDSLVAAARRAHLEMAIWYASPVHPLPRDATDSVRYVPGSCPSAEQRCREVVTLPTHSGVGHGYLQRVAKFFSNIRT